MAKLLLHSGTAQVAKPGIAAVSKTAGRKAAQVQILPWALVLTDASCFMPLGPLACQQPRFASSLPQAATGRLNGFRPRT